MIFTLIVGVLLLVQLLRFHQHALKPEILGYGALALGMTFALEFLFSEIPKGGGVWRLRGIALIEAGEITGWGWCVILIDAGIVVAAMVAAVTRAVEAERLFNSRAAKEVSPENNVLLNPSVAVSPSAQSGAQEKTIEAGTVRAPSFNHGALEHREIEVQSQITAHKVALAELEEKRLRLELLRQSGLANDLGDILRIMWLWPSWVRGGWEPPLGLIVVPAASGRSSTTANHKIVWFWGHAFTAEVHKNIMHGFPDSDDEELEADDEIGDEGEVPADTWADRLVLTAGSGDGERIVVEMYIGVLDKRGGPEIVARDHAVKLLNPGPWMEHIAQCAAALRELESKGYKRYGALPTGN